MKFPTLPNALVCVCTILVMFVSMTPNIFGQELLRKGLEQYKKGQYEAAASSVRTFLKPPATTPRSHRFRFFSENAKMAMKLSPPPDVIYLLSDGEIVQRDVEEIIRIDETAKNGKRIGIRTIAFQYKGKNRSPERIDTASGGSYKPSK